MQMMEGRDPSTNINLFKAAIFLHAKGLLKLNHIQDAITAYTAMNREFLEAGVPVRVSVLMRLLRLGNRFISKKVLELWLAHCKPLLFAKSKLLIWEFLFLYSNASNRQQVLLHDLPKTSHKLVKDTPETFKMEHDLNKSRAPDKWLHMHYDVLIDAKRVHFYTVAKKRHNLRRRRTSFVKKSTIYPDVTETELQRILRSPNLYSEIKSNLKDSRQRLKSAGSSRSTSVIPDIKVSTFLNPLRQDFQITPVHVPFSYTPSVTSLKSPGGNVSARPRTGVSHKKTRSTCVKLSQLDLPSRQGLLNVWLSSQHS